MGRHGLNDRINVANATIATLQTTVSQLTRDRDALIAANALITAQGKKIDTLEAGQAALNNELKAQRGGQTAMEAALRAEISALKGELAAETSRRETQNDEKDMKLRQIDERLQALTAKNHELLDMLSRLATRLNSVKEESDQTSFFGDSDVDAYDLPDMHDLATEFEKKLKDG